MTIGELKKWVDAAIRYNSKDTEVVCRSEDGEYFATSGFISKTGSVETDNISDFGEEERWAVTIDIFEREN
jgi:hypothetical protein